MCTTTNYVYTDMGNGASMAYNYPDEDRRNSLPSTLIWNTVDDLLRKADGQETGVDVGTAQIVLRENDDEALRLSAKYGHTDHVVKLIHRGANIHAREEEALCSACSYCQSTDVVRVLLNEKADVHARGGFALVCACRRGMRGRDSNADVVRELLAHGADASALGGCPLACASATGRVDIVLELLAHGTNVNGPEHWPIAWASHHVDVMRELLLHGAKINNKNGHEALYRSVMHALRTGDCRTVHLLLSHGARFSRDDTTPFSDPFLGVDYPEAHIHAVREALSAHAALPENVLQERRLETKGSEPRKNREPRECCVVS